MATLGYATDFHGAPEFSWEVEPGQPYSLDELQQLSAILQDFKIATLRSGQHSSKAFLQVFIRFLDIPSVGIRLFYLPAPKVQKLLKAVLYRRFYCQTPVSFVTWKASLAYSTGSFKWLQNYVHGYASCSIKTGVCERALKLKRQSTTSTTMFFSEPKREAMEKVAKCSDGASGSTTLTAYRDYKKT
ncbi:unnamed protein product [Symbiodinium microadriaticum]|nr:unnamed protein product [Symbiodinium microadriaticum]